MGRRNQKINLEEIEYTEGCGNVYTDLDMPNPSESKTKAELAMLITAIIQEKGFTQQEAAEKMGIDQPKVSKIVRGLLSEFSIERLMGMMLRLGFDIELRAKPHKADSTPPAIHVISRTLQSSRVSV